MPPIPRIYSAKPIVAHSAVELPEPSRRHVVQVLRLRKGNTLTLFDGLGGEFPAEITDISKRTMQVQIGEKSDVVRESPLYIHLLQGLSKGERMDYTVQKATEAGVAEITPIITERTVVRINAERFAKKLHHWQQIAISACEQSGRTRIPKIHPPLAFNKLMENLAQTPLQGTGFLMDTTGAHSFKSYDAPTNPIHFLVGPEGGITPGELEAARNAGFLPVQMGPRIFRTETMCVAAITAMQLLWGDF